MCVFLSIYVHLWLQILYEEIDDYKAFVDGFKIDEHTDEIAKVRTQHVQRDCLS